MAAVAESYREIRSAIDIVFDKHGFPIPQQPDPQAPAPRKWLIRGEPHADRLFSSVADFQPQSGQMGSHGVFMGDCLESVKHTASGVYFLFDRDVFGQDWIRVPSEEYRRGIEEIAIQHNLRVESLSGGLEAETILFQRTATYQPQTGIATIPYSVPLENVEAIFLPESLMDAGAMMGLPRNLKGKVIIF